MNTEILLKNAQGDFQVSGKRLPNDLYFPLVNTAGMISSITPELGGDCKHDQNTFLLVPSTRESLKSSKSTRNFWCAIENKRPWSVSGRSSWQQMPEECDAETVTLEGGLLWQRVTRENTDLGIRASVLSFIPAGDELTEIMQVIISNISDTELSFYPTAAIPLYGRSADNVRDHRHVTSLLGRMETTEYGVTLTPTLTFDERGHQTNTISYGVYAASHSDGSTLEKPLGFCPVMDDFTGPSGCLEWPDFVINKSVGIPSGSNCEGFEAIGAIRFAKAELKPGHSKSYQIILCIGKPNLSYLYSDTIIKALSSVRSYWHSQSMLVKTGDNQFNRWMRWVSVQPVFRRICGCSFMPDHDYGRGGRGWRDLWQDCLGLLLRDPLSQRGKLIAYLAGVRIDGSNATIIGTREGEFIADRNHIVRVWMDHGIWATRTLYVYINQTRDIEILMEMQGYFKDAQALRGDGMDKKWHPQQGTQLLDESSRPYKGSILEHLLVQNITAFYDVGEHNHIRLRGADWNDALDMAAQRGESVAFTAAYADNLFMLAECIDLLAHEQGIDEIALCSELHSLLMQDFSIFDDPDGKRSALNTYCSSVIHSVTGSATFISCKDLSACLRGMADWILRHIRDSEWISCSPGFGWFNSYYDNNGKQVERAFGENVRMMLTGQVFTILSGVSTDEQTLRIISATDRFLYHPGRGGYCLNTNFEEVLLDMGRMFGFAYGHKENGAVFCHMAVMYAYALYSRGFAVQGWKVLSELYRQSTDFKHSQILPGIPEYFDINGKGMYPYLTGSASWYVFTLQTQVFGVRGSNGNLLLCPKLLVSQFGDAGEASICVEFAGKSLEIVYLNHGHKDYGNYAATSAVIGTQIYFGQDGSILIDKNDLTQLSEGITHRIEVTLE